MSRRSFVSFGFLATILLAIYSPVATAELNRSRDDVMEGLVSAEICVAAVGTIAVLIKAGAMAKLGESLIKLDHVSVHAVQAASAALGYPMAEGTAWFIAKAFLFTGGSFSAHAIGKFIVKECHRGGQEIVIALRDVGPAVAILLEGSRDLERPRANDSPGVATGRWCAANTRFWTWRSRWKQCLDCCADSFADYRDSHRYGCDAVCNARWK